MDAIATVCSAKRAREGEKSEVGVQWVVSEIMQGPRLLCVGVAAAASATAASSPRRSFARWAQLALDEIESAKWLSLAEPRLVHRLRNAVACGQDV